jgi:hypothetical protein
MGGSAGFGGWISRPDYPKMASVDAAAELWSRTDLRPSDVDIAELYDGFTFLTFAWLEALGFCADGERVPSSKADLASRSMASCPSIPTEVNFRPVACTATGSCTRHASSCEGMPATGR